jgi:phosphate transport system substrate-binding protein
MTKWQFSSLFVVPIILLSSMFFGSLAIAQVQIDDELPSYKKVSGISGSIKSVGSDTMNNIMGLWTEKFREYYPNVQSEVEGQGSSKAMPALIQGAAAFGPMSRDAKDSEINDFEKKYGYKPVMIPTSIDMLAVYVHRDNPIQSLTFEQIDAIFSSTRKMGSKSAVTQWGQVGLTGDFANAPITIFGRNASSGTYGYFKEVVLGDGDYRNTINEQPGSSAVVQSVGENRFAIGYSGLGYKTESVKIIALDESSEGESVEATSENAYNGEYPLSRYLFLAMNYKPNSELDPLRREFLKFVFSKEGQKAVVADGYLPVNAEVARESLEMLGIVPKF